MAEFKIHSDYQPTGDQPQAIAALTEGVQKGFKHQVLLGVTGSGKTFTMANIIKTSAARRWSSPITRRWRRSWPGNSASFSRERRGLLRQLLRLLPA